MKLKGLLIGVLVFVIAMGVAYATDQTFNINCELVAPISITKNNDLEFGTQTITAQTVTVAPAAGTGPNGELAANFSVTGTANKAIAASVVEASVTITNGVDSLTISNFLVDDDGTDTVAAANPYNTTIPAGGTMTMYVGADLTIAGTESAGIYTGTATFRVVYN